MISPNFVLNSSVANTTEPFNSHHSAFQIEETTVEPVAYEKYRQWEKLRNHIKNFENMDDNWNGYNVSAPNLSSIDHSIRWLKCLFDSTMLSNAWINPMVSPDENGDIVFEWQLEDKWLCVIVSPSDVSYLCEGGMPEGSNSLEGMADTQSQREMLWRWLTA